MQCPKCGVECDNNTKFCKSCGSQINIVNDVETLENATINQPNMNMSPQNIQNNLNINQPIVQNDINVEQTSFQPNINQSPISSINQNNMVVNESVPVENSNSKKEKKPINKTLLVLIPVIAISILLIVLVAFLISKTNNKSTVLSEYTNIVLDPERPIIIKQEGKYGYISSKGKMIIEPKYETATDFYGEHALVTIENKELPNYKKTYQIIDKTGKVKLEKDCLFEPKYYSEYKVWLIEEVLYDENLKQISLKEHKLDYEKYGYFSYDNIEKNEYGLIDYKGNIVLTLKESLIAPQFSTSSDQKDTYVLFEDENDVAKIVSLKTGETIFSREDKGDYYIDIESNNIFRIVSRKNYKTEKSFYCSNGKIVYEIDGDVEIELYNIKNEIIRIDYGYDHESKGQENQYAYYDVKKKEMLKEKPDYNYEDTLLYNQELTYDYKIYEYGSKMGIIKNKKVILEENYDDIEFLNESLFNYASKNYNKDLVLLTKDDTVILYNLKNKKELITVKDAEVSDRSTSTFIEFDIYDDDYKREKTIYYNTLTDKQVEYPVDTEVTVYSNYIVVRKDGFSTYYNTKLEEIYKIEL